MFESGDTGYSRKQNDQQGRFSRWPWVTAPVVPRGRERSEEHTSELQSLRHLVCRLLLEKKNQRRDHDARRQDFADIGDLAFRLPRCTRGLAQGHAAPPGGNELGIAVWRAARVATTCAGE